jgi:hypothetical protein
MKYSLRSLMTFSIRDLLLVTVIVAILVAWWGDRSKLADEVRRLTPDTSLTIVTDPRWDFPTLQHPFPNRRNSDP